MAPYNSMVEDYDRSRRATDKALPHVNRRLTADEQRARAMGLRHQGWSYRRIAEELHLSYSLVSHWLDSQGTPWVTGVYVSDPPSTARKSGKAGDSAVPSSGAVSDKHLSSEQLDARMARLESRQQALEAEVRKVEKSLSKAIKDAYQSLSEKLRSVLSKAE